MNKSQHIRSRRAFIASLATVGAAIVLKPYWAWAIEDIDPRVAAIVAATIGIDTHNHIDVPLNTDLLPGPDIDLAGEMKKSGLSAICMTFALDYQKLTEPGQAWDRFQNGLTAMDAALKKNGMKRSLNRKDLESAHKKHKPTAIQSVEGSHFLEGKLERLGIAYKRGLRHLTLLHDSDASTPLGDVYTNPPKFGGLTAFGADVVRECNRLGILVDMTHGSNDTVNATLKIAAHPILLSHTGLDTQLGDNPNMARMMKPRLISKEQAKIVADAGGVIGIWTHLADTPLAYAQNIRAMVDVVGIDHVCIGTDTKLTPAYRNPGAFGLGGPGGGPGGHGHAGERTNEAWADQKAGFYYVVVHAMLKTGFTAEEIGKIGGGNFCQVFDAATAGK